MSDDLEALDVMAKAYATDILRYIDESGPARYREIDAQVDPSSSATMVERLNELRGLGALTRQSYDEIPPRVEYEVTAAGQELRMLVDRVAEWQADPDPTLDGGSSGNGGEADAD